MPRPVRPDMLYSAISIGGIPVAVTSSTAHTWNLQSTRQITLGGLFLALSVLLASTGWGMIALPAPAGAVTAMHLPIILAGIMGGPLMGGCAGCAFGLFAWMRFPAFDPLVHMLPRLFIGMVKSK